MKSRDIILTSHYPSPAGELILGDIDGRICMANWAEELHPGVIGRRLCRLLCADMREGHSNLLDEAARQLSEYFAGERREFDLPLLLAGTDFQKSVWRALQAIPFGTTLSYGGLAQLIGAPRAVRAVANAVGANPVSIIVPCHRVVGSDGSLTGYAGGLAAKRALLATEGITLDNLSIFDSL